MALYKYKLLKIDVDLANLPEVKRQMKCNLG